MTWIDTGVRGDVRKGWGDPVRNAASLVDLQNKDEEMHHFYRDTINCVESKGDEKPRWLQLQRKRYNIPDFLML